MPRTSDLNLARRELERAKAEAHELRSALGVVTQALAELKEESILNNGLSEDVLDEALYSSNLKTFDTGAVRTKDADNWRFDSISPHAERRLAAIHAEGDAKYGMDNWRKGMSFRDTMNHVRNHLNLHACGDRSEDHLAKAVWGLNAIMEYEDTHPELNDFYFGPKYDA